MKYLMLLCLLGLLLSGCYNNPDDTYDLCSSINGSYTYDGYCQVYNDGNIKYDLVCFDNENYIKLRFYTYLKEDEMLEVIKMGWDDCYIVKSK